MTPLGDKLAARIAADGPIPVAAWMDACLADPEHGYYLTRMPFGRAGDFTTAPEISQIFGELLGLWAAAAWDAAGRPSPCLLVEIGPGRGSLMRDALRAIGQALPAFRAAARVVLIETSPRLRAVQAETLGDPGIIWAEGLDGLPDLPLFLLANELLDALPTRQFLRTAAGWVERAVGWDGGRFFFTTRPCADPPKLAAAPGALLETAPARVALIESITKRLGGGAALLIDYGHARGLHPGDSLQAVRGHRFADPLTDPGEADLTTHVDFVSLAAAVPDHAWGPIPQRRLLLRLGAVARAQRLARGKDPATIAGIESALARLIAADGMGSLFLCLALCPPGSCPPGFSPEEAFAR